MREREWVRAMAAIQFVPSSSPLLVCLSVFIVCSLSLLADWWGKRLFYRGGRGRCNGRYLLKWGCTYIWMHLCVDIELENKAVGSCLDSRWNVGEEQTGRQVGRQAGRQAGRH